MRSADSPTTWPATIVVEPGSLPLSLTSSQLRCRNPPGFSLGLEPLLVPPIAASKLPIAVAVPPLATVPPTPRNGVGAPTSGASETVNRPRLDPLALEPVSVTVTSTKSDPSSYSCIAVTANPPAAWVTVPNEVDPSPHETCAVKSPAVCPDTE